MSRRRRDRGVVLVTILVVMALCVTVIVAMTTRSELATKVTSLNLDAGQVHALLLAGEASALSALIRDLQTAPEADGPSEPWARIAQSDTAVTNGRFQLTIWDEAARFNLNSLTEGSPGARQNLLAIVAAAGLPKEVAARIAATLQGGRPLLQNLDLVARAGLTAAEIAALDPFVTCTSDTTSAVNINTAPEGLLLALLRNPDMTARIATQRDEELITPAVLTRMGMILPAGLTLRSAYFGVRIVTTSGDAGITSYAQIHRWLDLDGQAHAVVIARKLGGQ